MSYARLLSALCSTRATEAIWYYQRAGNLGWIGNSSVSRGKILESSFPLESPNSSKDGATWRWGSSCASELCVLDRQEQAPLALPSPPSVKTNIPKVTLFVPFLGEEESVCLVSLFLCCFWDCWDSVGNTPAWLLLSKMMLLVFQAWRTAVTSSTLRSEKRLYKRRCRAPPFCFSLSCARAGCSTEERKCLYLEEIMGIFTKGHLLVPQQRNSWTSPVYSDPQTLNVATFRTHTGDHSEHSSVFGSAYKATGTGWGRQPRTCWQSSRSCSFKKKEALGREEPVTAAWFPAC